MRINGIGILLLVVFTAAACDRAAKNEHQNAEHGKVTASSVIHKRGHETGSLDNILGENAGQYDQNKAWKYNDYYSQHIAEAKADRRACRENKITDKERCGAARNVALNASAIAAREAKKASQK